MSVDFEFKERYDIGDLVSVMALLRGEGGCPWDRVQTHQSIRKNLIEETYEVVEAIDKDDSSMMKEELGDLLMQVLFHSEMEAEKGSFDFDDVCDGLCKKLILRHPHVFGDVTANTPAEVLKNWDEIKKREKGQDTATDTLLSVPKELPALMRAEKLQHRAAKTGFDYPDAAGAMADLDSEVAELKEAVSEGDAANIEEELGDVLFSAVNVSRFVGADAEEALTRSSEKFIRRFAKVESMASGEGLDMHGKDMDELNRLWKAAKDSD